MDSNGELVRTEAPEVEESVESDTPEDDGVSLEEILWQYRHALIDLDRRVGVIESRPTFAASVRSKRTGL